LGDVDEQAIWQEIEKRQKLEQEAAASGARQPPAAEAPAAPPAAEAPTPAAVDVDAMQAAAAARLPPEPAAGGCRIAFRLPDGSRLQRTFNTADSVAALQVGGGLVKTPDDCVVAVLMLAKDCRASTDVHAGMISSTAAAFACW
jgi:hypothetical protein